MKIAIIVHNLTGGGAERVAAMWATGFHQRGHQVVVVTYDNTPSTYMVPNGISIQCATPKSPNKILKTMQRFFSIRNILTKTSPDVVIDVMPAYWKRIVMWGISGKKISTEHWSFERPDNAKVRPKKINKIYLNRLYDYVTVLTQADKCVIGDQLKHVAVLPNPLALVPAMQMPKKDKIILAVGRLDGWQVKGFDLLIKVWGRVYDKADGWRLQIAGGGSEKSLKYLKRLCEEANVTDTVDFLGYQSDIQPFFSKASIFVLSSRYEGFGLVLIEAMSQGCACVACDYKGRQKEIIQTDNEGVLCEPENAEAIAKAIMMLITDEKKRKEVGENAIRRSHDYKLENIMDQWENIIKEIR